MGHRLTIILEKVKNWFEIETIDTGWEVVGATWKDEIKGDLIVLATFGILYLIYYIFGMYGIISTFIILAIIILRKKIIYRLKKWRNCARISEKSRCQIKCLNCEKWFPSPIQFGDSASFFTSYLMGYTIQCPYCRQMTIVNKDNTFFENEIKGTTESVDLLN